MSKRVASEQTSTEPVERLISIKVAAEQLGVSGMTVRRLISEGELPGIRVRGDLRIAQGDLIDFVRRRRAEARARWTERCS
jgi:excisionase family DNA binding protein